MRPHPSPSWAHRDFTARRLIRDAFAVRERLALQLHFSLEVRSLCFGLVSASPERPCDNASGLDAALHELEGDTTDFLDRPADQERRLIDRRGNVFLGPTAAALAR